jgi:hypothetical protein
VPGDGGALARSVMRRKITMLQEAFTGYFTDHHAFLLAKMLARVDAIDADIIALDTKIEQMIGPFTEAARRLEQIPGISATAACAILAEIGTSMDRCLSGLGPGEPDDRVRGPGGGLALASDLAGGIDGDGVVVGAAERPEGDHARARRPGESLAVTAVAQRW